MEILFPGKGNREIKFRHISLEEGLSESSIRCMLQDNRGFMWFGTWDGLNKYDGYTFKIYRPDSENPNNLSHNIINAIHEDHLGAYWIGTNGGGLNKFDREKEQKILFSQLFNFFVSDFNFFKLIFSCSISSYKIAPF